MLNNIFTFLISLLILLSSQEANDIMYVLEDEIK